MRPIPHFNRATRHSVRGWFGAAALVALTSLVAGLVGCQMQFSLDSTPGEPLIADLLLPTNKPSALKGKAIWDAKCVSCHQETGKGLVTGGGPDFTDPQWIFPKAPQEIFAAVYWGEVTEQFEPVDQTEEEEHSGASPAQRIVDESAEPRHQIQHQKFEGQLTQDDVWNVVAYVWQFSVRQESLPSELGFPQIRTLFGRNCATCHGKEGFGDGPNAKFLVPPPRNFHRQDFMVTVANERLFRSITEGRPGTAMPPWGQLGVTDDQRRQLIDFIRSSFTFDAMPISADDAKALSKRATALDALTTQALQAAGPLPKYAPPPEPAPPPASKAPAPAPSGS